MVSSSPARSRRPPRRAQVSADPTPRDRFRSLDAYRARREWARYEGTGQRDLFRRLRERFLARHPGDGWVLDVGSGPGRFTSFVGGPRARRVAIDLAEEMLREHRRRESPDLATALVRGDVLRPPLRGGTFGVVAVLGNAVGFGGPEALRTLASAAGLVGPGGRLLVETAPGAPTFSRYLKRLPSSAMVRLLRSPPAALVPRVEREGYGVVPSNDRTRHGFRPIGEEELSRELRRLGFDVVESTAVAPALGGDRERVEAVRADPAAWERLVLLEEELGARPAARVAPPALLTAAVRRPRPEV